MIKPGQSILNTYINYLKITKTADQKYIDILNKMMFPIAIFMHGPLDEYVRRSVWIVRRHAEGFLTIHNN
jgi:hypothetical protein